MTATYGATKPWLPTTCASSLPRSELQACCNVPHRAAATYKKRVSPAWQTHSSHDTQVRPHAAPSRETMRVSLGLCGKVSSFPRQHRATWPHGHVLSMLARPPTTKSDQRHKHKASHVLFQDHGYVPAVLLHSALARRKLPSSFYPHDVHQTRSPRGGAPTAELLQSLAPCPRTMWHPPRSNPVQLRGFQSQVVT